MWSAEQEAVIDNSVSGKGHSVALARAGSGKTKTLVEVASRIEKARPLMVAFNKKIADELKDKAPRNARVSTLHSYGYRQVRRALGNIELDRKGKPKIYRLMSDNLPSTQNLSYDVRLDLAKAVSLAKSSLLFKPHDIDALIDSHDLDFGTTPMEREAFVKYVIDLLTLSKDDLTEVNFDDMVWLPLVLELPCEAFKRVLIDETQDLSTGQIELAKRACSPKGRITAFGDDRQCIYRFSGASLTGLEGLIQGLDAEVFLMSRTYRCGKAIVEAARAFVPDFVADESCPDGHVRRTSRASLLNEAQPGDFVLSRTNAPLVGLCLKMLLARKPAAVLGKALGKGLTKLVKQSKAETVPLLLKWVEDWEQSEIERLRAKKRSTTLARDKAECLREIMAGAQSVGEVHARIEKFFVDDERYNCVLLSTVHKAKGMERDRVFMLEDSFKRPSYRTLTAEDEVVEQNLRYVAITRAREELIFVDGAVDER
jgi:superfamily I DNA/RNA helicase